MKKQHCKDSKGYVWNAEAKILVIMCLYIVMGSVTLCTFSYFVVTANETSEAFQTYFSCQSVVMVPDRDCGDVRLQGFNVLAFAANLSQGLFPAVVLIFVVSCPNYKNRLGRDLHKSTLPN